jgi:hypothetical protein
MKYIVARIRPRHAHLGYDAQGVLRTNTFEEREFVEKVIKIDRILSFTDDHIFIACPHETVQVWDYEGDLSQFKDKLRAENLLIE